MDEIAKRMADLAEKYGPNVIEAARGATRVEAYSSMVSSGLALFAAVAFGIVGYWLFKKGANDDGWYIAAGIVWVIAAICFFPGIWGFIDPWVYTAINNPDLWIAKKVLKL